MRNANNLIVFCECESPEHMITLDDFGDDCIYMSYHLAPLSFFERLKHAIKYVFGYRSQYGDFGEMLISTEAAKEIREYLRDFLEKNNCACVDPLCGCCNDGVTYKISGCGSTNELAQ